VEHSYRSHNVTRVPDLDNCALGTVLRRTYYSDVQNGPYFHGLIYGTFSGCGAVQVATSRG